KRHKITVTGGRITAAFAAPAQPPSAWHLFCAASVISIALGGHLLLKIIVIVLISVTLTSLYFVISRRRRTPKYQLNPDELPEVGECLLKFAGMTKSAVHRGNEIQVYQNGALFPALIESIEAAKDTIHLETFVWDKGELER